MPVLPAHRPEDSCPINQYLSLAGFAGECDDQQVADDNYCYLTTTGRTSRHPHRIEIWYGRHGDTLYLMSGGGEKADWVKNLTAKPTVKLELDAVTYDARARVITDADEADRARTLLFDKYTPRTKDDLSRWRERALPVAVDLGASE